MSDNAYAHLAYGYNLGSSWRFAGLPEGEVPDWLLEEDGEQAEESDEAALEQLLLAAGFAGRPDDGLPDYKDRRDQAIAALGLEFLVHGSFPDGEEFGCILAAKTIQADVYEPTDVGDLTPAPEWRQRLDHAVDVLGLEVSGQQPRWMVVASYG